MRAPADANLDELKKKARRRLVGAVVLALAAAVFVPMLLESDERPLGDDVSVRIPAVDQGKFVNRLNAPSPAPSNPGVAADPGSKGDAAQKSAAPVPKADAAKVATSADASKGATPASAAPAKSLSDSEQRVLGTSNSVAPVTERKSDAVDKAANATGDARSAAPPGSAKSPAPAVDDSSRKSPATESKAPPSPQAHPTLSKAGTAVPAKGSNPATKSARGFDVQLAAFADDKGANALANRLKRSGHAAFTEPVTTARGTLWRVRVGPFTSREEATAARDKLKREGQNGIVAARSS
ncbi:MAG: SPOR domain-containing protein [Casimicrobiaceae bacterium]